MSSRRKIFLALGPALGVLLGVGLFAAGLPDKAAYCAAVTALCATWWVTEPIPIPATSLIPFGAFPLLGVLSHTEVATSYGHSLILLLLGGFMLSMAMEKSGAHRRLALGMVRLVGGVGGRRLVLGFMVAAAALSMWISNTATTLMLLPVALAVVDQANDEELTVPLLLGMAYAASVGGIGTPVGTPPNVILMGVYQEETGKEISFLEWMTIGVPVVLAMLPLMWLWLTRRLGPAKTALELPDPGPWRTAERRVLVVFALTALAWVTRSDPAGGWSALIGATGTGDATVALVAVVALFLIPDGDQGQLLDWPTGPVDPLRRRDRDRPRLRGVGAQPGARRGLERVDDLAAAPDARHHRPVGHVPDRGDQQHRDDLAADAGARRGRGSGSCRSAPADGAGGDQRELRVHAPRRHRPERHRLRHRALHDPPHGVRGLRAQPARRRRHHRRLLPAAAAVESGW